MDVFIFCADIYCEDCGNAFREAHKADGPSHPNDESSYDSDDFPKGPYTDGGGEADSPQHCGSCRIFLENPLTGDGADYVRDAFREHIETGRGAVDVLKEWRAFYDYVWDDFESITLDVIREDGLSPVAEKRYAELAA